MVYWLSAPGVRRQLAVGDATPDCCAIDYCALAYDRVRPRLMAQSCLIGGREGLQTRATLADWDDPRCRLDRQRDYPGTSITAAIAPIFEAYATFFEADGVAIAAHERSVVDHNRD